LGRTRILRNVVFEAEIGVDVLLTLEVARDDAGAIGEGEEAARGGELVSQPAEKAAAKWSGPEEKG
jgi:hypothetical protein